MLKTEMPKNKSIDQIEKRMETVEPGSLRYETLGAARDFKSSWIHLGKYLFSIYRDKLFRDWGYLTFEAYCAKEIGIRKETAGKLLKSYYFLESEEPSFLRRHLEDNPEPHQIPNYESVNALRLAKGRKEISDQDYQEIREQVLDHAREDKEVKKKIKYILKTNAPPTSNTKEGKSVIVVRVVSQLSHLKDEAENLSLPGRIVKQIEALLDSLAGFSHAHKSEADN